MKQANTTVMTLALFTLSFMAYAYDDPQNDYDALYTVDTQIEPKEHNAADIAVLETISQTNNDKVRDPQTDYDSLYMTRYLKHIENNP